MVHSAKGYGRRRKNRNVGEDNKLRRQILVFKKKDGMRRRMGRLLGERLHRGACIVLLGCAWGHRTDYVRITTLCLGKVEASVKVQWTMI